jgi:hypothetical protein
VRFSVDPSRLFPSELSSPSTAANELSLDGEVFSGEPDGTLVSLFTARGNKR